MLKRILMIAALWVPLAAFAADAAGGPATLPAAPAATQAPNRGEAAPAQPDNGGVAKRSQHSKARELRANCNKRADGKRLTGEARKVFIAKCEKGG